MVKLKKYKLYKAVCDVCKGNGYVKIVDPEDLKEVNIHQCWECDSEGEFYVYEPPMASDTDADNGDDGTNNLLH